MPRGLVQRGFRLTLAALIAAALLATGGCGGDSEDDPQQQAAKKKKEEPKPDFEVGRLMTQPNSFDLPETSFKPGHWTSATLEATCNARDFKGDLTTEPFELDGVPFDMSSSRPALLPKGQKKYLELTFYVPPGKAGSRIATRLLSSRWGSEVAAATQRTFRMPEHQFYFVVLARTPDRYAFLKVLDSVRPPMGLISDEKMTAYYRVLLPRVKAKTPVPLPSHAGAWTSIAYLLWDDLDPGSLSSEQQQALLDWLHWGGQLIVSGPGTMDTLRGSFLEPYLPATADGPTEVTTATLKDINARWTQGWANEPGRPLAALKPWTGVRLSPRAGTVILVPWNPTTQAERAAPPLVVERRVGRGRIVLSAFGLSQRELVVWPSFDGFVNGCLLRRLPRQYARNDVGETRLTWKDPGQNTFDPQLVSTVRYFTRDAASMPVPVEEASAPAAPPAPGKTRPRPQPFQFGLAPPLPPGFAPPPGQPGAPAGEDLRLLGGNEDAWLGTSAAGWGDFNEVANTARDSLRRAAGVVIPRGSFILLITAAYLLVLVPLNWAVFHVMGRVEWAWFAVPVIAVAGAVAVVKLARLDIGFVRAKTEIAVVEIQGDYSRAHVTRYTALYTSLSTRYDAHFDDPGALAQPFAAVARSGAMPDRRRETIEFRREEDVCLSGFAVASNSTGMLHSEQMLDMEGSLSLGRTRDGEDKLTNGTRLLLEGVAVVRPRRGGAAGELEAAWVRSLDRGAAVLLRFGALDEKFLAETWDTMPATARLRPAASGNGSQAGNGAQAANGAAATNGTQAANGSASSADVPPETLNLRALIDLARDPKQYQPGDVRLIAWVDKELPGMRIEPASSQGRHAALVVANLSYHAGAAPQPDANARPPMNKPLDEE